MKQKSIKKEHKTKSASKTIFALLFFFLIIQTVHASFEDTGIGARTAGLNNAFTADADDVYSIYYNPAGLVQLAFPEFSSYYGKMYMGLSDDSNLGNNFFAYAHPLKIKEKYALGEERMKQISDYGTVAVAYQEFRLDSLYRETSLYVSYARVFLPNFFVGLTAKSLGLSYGSDDYTQNAISNNGRSKGGVDPLFENGKSKRGMSFDLGMIYQPFENTKFGLMFANINQPDMSLKSAGDKVNLGTKLGVSQEMNWGKINFDVIRENRLASVTDTNANLGYENWIDIGRYGELGLRCGAGEGSRGYRKVSMGFSYRVNLVELDYGFSIPLKGIQDTMGSHRLSMTFRFGKEVKDEDLGELLEKEERLFLEAKSQMKQAQEEKKRLEFEIQRMKAEIEGVKKGDMRLKEKELGQVEETLVKAQTKYQEAFNIAYRFYKTKLMKGINLRERIIIMEKVVEKYRLVGVNVSVPEKELQNMKAELGNVIKDYEMANKYYQSMVERGATEKERREILKKLIEKYSASGIDMSPMREELKKMGNGNGD